MRAAALLSLLTVCGCHESADRNATGDAHAATTRETTQSNDQTDATNDEPQPPVVAPFEPVTVTVKQRSTTALAKLDQQLHLTVDDVTGGQVITSVSYADGTVLQAPISLRPGDTLTFQHAGRPFRLELLELHNARVGEDVAEFELSVPEIETEETNRPAEPATEPDLTEREKTEMLIAAVAAQSEARFVRNGREHSSQEAAEHLRRKWEAASGRVGTAEEFIEHVASRSSLTGKPYVIRFPDGSETTAAEFLRDKLATLPPSPSH